MLILDKDVSIDKFYSAELIPIFQICAYIKPKYTIKELVLA